ncbi:hypothetical protein MMC07_001268 [Pseudocyphellaria aurata]|nr:hypothetical protein [Pseudocyphellaria aurata]
MSKDSSYSYVHLHKAHFADLFEEFNRAPQLPHQIIYVRHCHQPPNPEDEDDVVPDQHAAFGITRVTQPKREPAWKALGMDGLVRQGPSGIGEGSSAGWGAGIGGRDGKMGSSGGSASGSGLGRGLRKREGLGGGLPT